MLSISVSVCVSINSISIISIISSISINIIIIITIITVKEHLAEHGILAALGSPAGRRRQR